MEEGLDDQLIDEAILGRRKEEIGGTGRERRGFESDDEEEKRSG